MASANSAGLSAERIEASVCFVAKVLWIGSN
jgi:hypothetical protein